MYQLLCILCKKGYKNNSLRTFVLLRWLSEDDTILIGKLMYLFGVLRETYWRMFHRSTVPVGAGAVFYFASLFLLVFTSANIPYIFEKQIIFIVFR